MIVCAGSPTESPTELGSPVPSENSDSALIHRDVDTLRGTRGSGFNGKDTDRLEMLYNYDRLSHGGSMLSDSFAAAHAADRSTDVDDDENVLQDSEGDDSADDATSDMQHVRGSLASPDHANAARRSSPSAGEHERDSAHASDSAADIGAATGDEDQDESHAREVHVAKHRRAGSFVVNDMGNLKPAPRVPKASPPTTAGATTARKKHDSAVLPDDSAGKRKPQRRVSIVAATGDAFWPSGHRRIAYDGGIIPDPTAWRANAPTEG